MAQAKENSPEITKPKNLLFEEVLLEPNWSYSKFSKKNRLQLSEAVSEEAPRDAELKNNLEQQFLSGELNQYLKHRNGLMPEKAGTNWSVALARNEVSVAWLNFHLQHLLSNDPSNSSLKKIVDELLWREYFHHRHPWVRESLVYRAEDEHVRKVLLDLKETQLPNVFSASLSQLVKTGWLSNRSRQWFAFLWLNELKKPWTEGAELFAFFLKDHDPWINTGNWRLIAGVGENARGPITFDMTFQKNRYDPEGHWEQYWLNQNWDLETCMKQAENGSWLP